MQGRRGVLKSITTVLTLTSPLIIHWLTHKRKLNIRSASVPSSTKQANITIQHVVPFTYTTSLFHSRCVLFPEMMRNQSITIGYLQRPAYNVVGMWTNNHSRFSSHLPLFTQNLIKMPIKGQLRLIGFSDSYYNTLCYYGMGQLDIQNGYISHVRQGVVPYC